MRGYLPWMGLAGVVCGLAVIAESQAAVTQSLPSPFPMDRYQQMTMKSPFAVASAAGPAAAAPTPGFAAQLYVVGVAHIGPKDWAAIKSHDPDHPNSMFVAVGGTSDDGMHVDRVMWSDETAKSKVEVSKNGEKATLSFDEALMKAPAAPVPGMVTGPGVRMPTMFGGGGRPVAFPGQPVQPAQPGIPVQQRVRTMPAIPPPQVIPNSGVQPPGQLPQPGGVDIRRRARLIQSGQ